MIPMRALHSRMRGFTAIEMMIVVVIIAILTAIAAPNMGAMIRNQRVKTAAFDIFATLTYARSEAVKRNLSVTVAAKDAADWTKGWTVKDSNNTTLKDETDRQLNADELRVSLAPAAVTFARTGRLAGGAAPQFSLTATNVSADRFRCITVDLSGRPVSKEGAC